MKPRLQIAALFLVVAVKSNAEDFALLDSEHGISSVEVLEDNIANLQPPDMIEVLAHLKPAREQHSKPADDGPGKKSGKPDNDSKSKSKKSKTKKTTNGDKMKDKNKNSGREKSKLSKSEQHKEKPDVSKTEASEKDGKKHDDDATKDADQGKSGDSPSEKDGKSEKSPKTTKKSKSEDEDTKINDGDSKIESEGTAKDGKSSNKSVGSESDSDKNDKDGKSDSRKPDSDVTDDKAKLNQDKSESDQSGEKSKKDEKKAAEKLKKATDDENAGSDEASKMDSTKVDEIPKKIQPDKAKKAKKQSVSEAEKASHDVSTDHDDSQAADSKKSRKKQQKDSKKNKKKKSKSKKRKSMTEMDKAREGAISNKTPDKTVGDSETPVNDGSRSYSLESLKHICDVIDEPENDPAHDVTEVDSPMRAFVPILTNKPEMDKSRRKKKKKISAKSERSKLLFGCEDAKPKDISKFDGQGGITTIYSQASKSRITIYCDNTTLGGGWTVFQRRVDGKLDFDRGYGAYQRGFGELSGEHWLGLDAVANITAKDKYKLRLEMTDAGGKKMIANYGEFSVSSQEKGYRLKISDFTEIRLPKDVLASYDGQKFSTFNQDETKSQCGSRLQSGFWFDNCSTSSPNGKYFISPFKSRRPSGIYWKPIPGKFGPITQIEMKFRKKEE